VPADSAGLYLIKVTQVGPGSASASDHLVRTVVEIRQPGTKGSATVLTPDNRSHYGRGEDIPFTVAVRPAGQTVTFTVRLVDGDRTLAQAEAEATDKPPAFKVPGTLTAALRSGTYSLTVTAPGLTCTGQPLVIGPGLRKPLFHVVQHGDYNQLYPAADVWDAPDLTAAHAARTAKLGVNLMVDRVGSQIDLLTHLNSHLAWNPDNRAELDALFKRVDGAAGGVSPQKSSMARCCSDPAGLRRAGGRADDQPGVDGRGLTAGQAVRSAEAQTSRDLTRVTEAAKPYPSFRGWSWAANWWVWREAHAKGSARSLVRGRHSGREGRV
jgi:hypothetical protein